MPRLAFCVLVAIAAATGAARAQTTVIYRCTDAQGALTIQNGTACPKGSKQEKRVIDTPMAVPAATLPAPVPAALPPSPPPKPIVQAPAPTPLPPERPQAPPATAIADADRLPPPPIFQCNTWDNDHYLSEDGAPKPRCVALQTTDLSGDPASGIGQACEEKTDQCQRVPDGAACDAWKKRQREVEASWRFAKAADKQTLQDEYARVTRIVNESTCGQ
jgi:hypothetical protein